MIKLNVVGGFFQQVTLWLPKGASWALHWDQRLSSRSCLQPALWTCHSDICLVRTTFIYTYLDHQLMWICLNITGLYAQSVMLNISELSFIIFSMKLSPFWGDHPFSARPMLKNFSKNFHEFPWFTHSRPKNTFVSGALLSMFEAPLAFSGRGEHHLWVWRMGSPDHRNMINHRIWMDFGSQFSDPENPGTFILLDPVGWATLLNRLISCDYDQPTVQAKMPDQIPCFGVHRPIFDRISRTESAILGNISRYSSPLSVDFGIYCWQKCRVSPARIWLRPCEESSTSSTAHGISRRGISGGAVKAKTKSDLWDLVGITRRHYWSLL